MNYQQTPIYISKEMLDRVQDLAERSDRSRNAMFRVLIEIGLRQWGADYLRGPREGVYER